MNKTKFEILQDAAAKAIRKKSIELGIEDSEMAVRVTSVLLAKNETNKLFGSKLTVKEFVEILQK